MTENKLLLHNRNNDFEDDVTRTITFDTFEQLLDLDIFNKYRKHPDFRNFSIGDSITLYANCKTFDIYSSFILGYFQVLSDENYSSLFKRNVFA